MSNPRALAAAGAGTQDRINVKRLPPSSSPAVRIRQRPTLSEPVTVSQWWKNRIGESIRVSLGTYKNHNVLNVRTWWTDDDGVLKPGKGFSCSVRHAPKLAAALAKAVGKAIEFGLIDSAEDGNG